MIEQDSTQASTKRRRSRQTSKQNETQIPALQRPTDDDKEAWKAYWKAQGQPWRTEPEIDKERQEYLSERRGTTPNIGQGIYPFKDIKLSRADIEWLLSTHAEKTWQTGTNLTLRYGIDLRGANLRGADLQRLPLAGILAGLEPQEWFKATKDQREAAAIHLEGANLTSADLSQAQLKSAYLEGTDLSKAHFEFASLRGAHLGGKTITERCIGEHSVSVHNVLRLPPANLQYAHFNMGTTLEETDLGNEKDGYVRLVDVRWGGINLAAVNWGQVKMLGNEQEANRDRTSDGKLKDQATRLKEYEVAIRANRQLAVALQTQGLNEAAARFAYHAQLCQKNVLFLQLMQRLKQQIHIPWVAALLFVEKLQGKRAEQRIAEMILMLGPLLLGFGLLMSSHVPVHSIFFSSDTRGSGTFILFATIFGILFIGLSIVGLFFYVTPEASLALFFLFMSLLQVLIPIGVYILVNALLSHVDWLLMVALSIWILLFIALFIGRFKFNAWFFLTRKMSNSLAHLFSKFRPLVGVQIAYGRYIFAWLLDLLAGYGYRPGRSIIAYLLIIGGFASLYTMLGHLPAFPDAIVFSVASFHGRGFFPNFEGQQQLTLSNPLVVFAAIEAVIGLIIEISFIATFTQRYFGK